MQTHVLNGAVLNLPYDVVKDFEPIALIADTPQSIITRSTFPANNLKEMIAWLKANPDKGTSGAVGVGGPSDISAYQFQKQTGTSFQVGAVSRRRPVADGSGRRPDRFQFRPGLDLSSARSATASSRRWRCSPRSDGGARPKFPPWMRPACRDFTGRTGTACGLPKGTPKDVVAKLNAAVVAALADPMVQQRFKDTGQSTWPRAQQTPEALAAHQKAEIERWWPIIKAAGIKGE